MTTASKPRLWRSRASSEVQPTVVLAPDWSKNSQTISAELPTALRRHAQLTRARKRLVLLVVG